ncbi:MAG: hypothetical protein A3B25_01040 [Candidatus Ryanbacteria bacterium RIFCSPLOWO2_01_FULL_48_26]|uniref:Proline--tRNA ligase n=1 Tax=Candidatus Ryanbacteria bacterium RIFCSPLOWO2_01_FULL_48_26 TaxID=1802126 RepID=A0A1G2GRK5_9BACT|nr:MAG: hypothetical protein A3B25_01040 [Candidatus Ryanbacteria bacterium RIFCSPLOWO2_01_FULL_48_26]
MLQSKLFTKVSRNAPKGEVAVNAQLLERGGFIYKNSAGVYSFLPLGWRVMQNIARIIREEMDAIGGQEIFMPALVEKKYLEATGRFDVPVGFDAIEKGSEKPNFSLGWTHEEVLTAIAARFVSSYNDLPFAAYQIQTKFRNEARAKSGLLRGREFMMKDLYSFHASEEDLNQYYEKVAVAYHKIFSRVGVKAIYTLAAGGDFTLKNTHEFQVVADVGEDIIYLCRKCGYAENKEISKLASQSKCPACDGEIEEKKSIEVGNIFPLGTKYSEAFNLNFTDTNGDKKLVVMGSYGIGLGRLMGTVVELYHDDGGMQWPEAIAPYAVHLLELNGAKGEQLYASLQGKGVQVLYDDRDMSAGQKLVESDLIGIPWRLVVSPKLSGKAEIKYRKNERPEIVRADAAEILKKLRQNKK